MSSTILKLNEEFFINIEDETAYVVSYDAETESYFKLTGLALDVLKIISDSDATSIVDLSNKLINDYECSLDELKVEVSKIIQKMKDKNIL